ncbi:hypothetical protein KCP73_26480 [Salmonella enterica subsp. enterica]|nr:hypothetical protein KCP73_26480 [Salmonella enterica subsp. enterica]
MRMVASFKIALGRHIAFIHYRKERLLREGRIAAKLSATLLATKIDEYVSGQPAAGAAKTAPTAFPRRRALKGS